MSRTGIILMLGFLFFRFILSRRYQLKAGYISIIISGLIFGLLYYFWDQIYYYSGNILEGALSTDSLDIRVRAWIATIDIIQVNPLFGVPRSYYKDALEAVLPGMDLWDPHNSVLHLLVSFGFVGFIFYASYVVVVFREFYRASLSNRFWKGVCWGYSLILVWSLFEPILLTPGIEMLQAYLLVLARKYRVNRRFKSLVYSQRSALATDCVNQYGQNRTFAF
jgi:O-antigen ligase